MNDRKKVAILVHTGNDWSRSVLMGVAQYAHESGGWDFTHPVANASGEVTLPKGWDGSGIICRLTSESLKRQIMETGIAAVNVSWLGKHSQQIVKVVSDEQRCGQIAAEYFLERHFRNFAFVGFPSSQDYSSMIQVSIEKEISGEGLELEWFSFSEKELNREQLRKQLVPWICGLSKPAALIVWTSHLGRIVSSICLEQGFSVPDQIALLCIEHDDLASSLSPVPLSNLDQDPWKVGYVAAQTLDQLMSGKGPMLEPVTVPPLTIVQRKSTESSAVDDPTVREAYRYIYESVTHGINVDDLVREMGISRRTLEKRFQESFEMSPAKAIRRARIQVVKRLLRETTFTVPQIAERSGFSHPEVLIRAFKKETGQTPTQFRHPT